VVDQATDWALPVKNSMVAPSGQWALSLAKVAAAVAQAKGVSAPAVATPDEAAAAIAQSLLRGERKAVLLGNAAAHHGQFDTLLSLANWIGEQTGAQVGVLTEAANTVGAQLAGALPKAGALNAAQMLGGVLKAVVLLNVEPGADSALDGKALAKTDMVVTLSPFKTNLDISDVLLPVSPFTETSGTFVNAEGRAQGFHAVVKPLGDTRPAWKVLRVLGNMLQLDGFTQESSQDVYQAVCEAGLIDVNTGMGKNLSNRCAVALDLSEESVAPVSASIYQLDGIVRRAPALQATADGRAALSASGEQA
jgi:NADH-quinone oxidoreductase subunit G